MSEVKEVIKFKCNPCKIGRAAVPPILAGSVALWKLIHFLANFGWVAGPVFFYLFLLWPPTQLSPSLPADARGPLSFSLKHAPPPFLATCHSGSAAPAAGQISSSLVTAGSSWPSRFSSSPSTPMVWKQGETLTPFDLCNVKLLVMDFSF